MIFRFRTVAAILAPVLLFQCILPAQDTPAQTADGPKLNIVIIEGEDAINNISQRTAREAIVQVEDENHKPVAGALVTFALPNSGPTGTFANGSQLFTATTDARGRAVMRGLRPSSQGKMQIRVSATSDGKTGSTTLTQNNIAAAAAAAVSAKLILILSLIGGAAAAGGIYAATRGGGGSTAPNNTVILTPGSPSVGPPR